jgi:hypothetical protein
MGGLDEKEKTKKKFKRYRQICGRKRSEDKIEKIKKKKKMRTLRQGGDYDRRSKKNDLEERKREKDMQWKEENGGKMKGE